MRFLHLLFAGTLVLFCACENPEVQHKEVDPSTRDTFIIPDSIPEAKWNGEYLEIHYKEKKREKKSLSSSFYRMGNVQFSIDTQQIKITLFNAKKNILTFTDNEINALITSGQSEQMHIVLTKKNIITAYKGNYKTDSTVSNQLVIMEVNINSNHYTFVDGTTQLINFSPQRARLKLKFEGFLLDNEGKKYKSEGVIDMKFETAIKTGDYGETAN